MAFIFYIMEKHFYRQKQANEEAAKEADVSVEQFYDNLLLLKKTNPEKLKEVIDGLKPEERRAIEEVVVRMQSKRQYEEMQRLQVAEGGKAQLRVRRD